MKRMLSKSVGAIFALGLFSTSVQAGYCLCSCPSGSSSGHYVCTGGSDSREGQSCSSCYKEDLLLEGKQISLQDKIIKLNIQTSSDLKTK